MVKKIPRAAASYYWSLVMPGLEAYSITIIFWPTPGLSSFNVVSCNIETFNVFTDVSSAMCSIEESDANLSHAG